MKRSGHWDAEAIRDAIISLMARDPYMLARYGADGTHCPIILHASGAAYWCAIHRVIVDGHDTIACPERIAEMSR